MRARSLLAAVFLISLSMGCLPGTDFKVSLRIIDAETGEPIKDAWVLVGAYLGIEPPLDPPYNVGLGATRGMSDQKGMVRFRRLEGMYEGEKPQDPLWKMLESRQPKIARRIKGVKGGSIVLFAPGYGAVHQPFGISDNPDFQKELRERNLKPEEYVGWFGEGPEDWNYKPLFLKSDLLKAKKTITLKVRKPANPEHRFASFQPEVLWYSAIATSWRTGTSVKEKERIYEFFKEQMKYAAEVSDNPFYKAQGEALKDPEHKKEFIAFTLDKTYESLESDPIPAIPADFRNTRLSRAPAPEPQPEPEIHNHDTTVHVWMTKKVLELLPEEYEEIREHEADIIEGVRVENSVLRVLKHFYNPHDPEAGYGNNDTALKWGAIGYPDHPKNEWDWEDALRYYREGDKKKAYKALGHVLHLLEDLSVPMHTRKIRHVYYLDAAAEFEMYFARLAKRNGDSLPDEYGAEAKRPKLVTGIRQPFEAVAQLTFGEFEQEGNTIRFADYYAWEAGKNGRLMKKPEAATIDLMGKHLLPRAIEYAAGVSKHFFVSLHPKASVSSKAASETATDATNGSGAQAKNRTVRKVREHKVLKDIRCARFHPNGKPLLEFSPSSTASSSSREKSIWVKELRFFHPSGKLNRILHGPGALTFSRRKRTVLFSTPITQSERGEVLEAKFELLNEDGTSRWEIASASTAMGYAYGVSEQGRVIVSSPEESEIWDAGKVVADHLPPMEAIWSGDGEYFASFGGYSIPADVKTRTPIRQFLVVRLYDKAGSLVWEKDLGEVHKLGAAVSESGKYVGLNYFKYRGRGSNMTVESTHLVVFNRKGEEVIHPQLPTGSYTMMFDPKERFLLIQVGEKLKAFGLYSNTPIWEIHLGEGHAIESIDMRPDGQRILFATRRVERKMWSEQGDHNKNAEEGNRLRIIDKTGRKLSDWTVSGRLERAAFTEDGAHVRVELPDRVEEYEPIQE